jgi:hypothetical protein
VSALSCVGSVLGRPASLALVFRLQDWSVLLDGGRLLIVSGPRG